MHLPLSLAGNFAEPRPNHFHGGIDVRTQSQSGRPVFSIGEGYVSAVSIGLYGFGNAVYVAHPDGHTSVYCHLKGFIPHIEALAEKYQYKKQCSGGHIVFKPNEYPVSQGQLIAISGTTGASVTPHLHLEMHETKTNAMVDPLLFLKDYLSDKFPPIAHAFMACPKAGEGVFSGGTARQSYGFNALHLSRTFTAWGKVGFAIWANDYMEDSFGRLGVYHTTLSVDGKTVFESRTDRIPQEENMTVNHWGDYDHFKRFNIWYMKSFKDEGNKLEALKVYNADRGYVTFNQEKTYHLVYTVEDIKGNQRSYSFDVVGKPTTFAKKKAKQGTMLLCRKSNVVRASGAELFIRRGLLAKDTPIKQQCWKQDGRLSHRYAFAPASTPLLGWAQVSIRVNQKVKDPSKLYITATDMKSFSPSTYKNGWVKGRIRDLGRTYEVAYDDTPPSITQPSISGRYINFPLLDEKSGVKSYKAYVDGEFVLFKRIDKTCIARCDLEHSPIRKTGKRHTLRLLVEDNCKNTRTLNTTFIY